MDTKKHLMQFIIYSISYVTHSALYQRWSVNCIVD